MNGNRILLGVTGGIAAYKSPELVRRLRERGAQVQVVMTAGAQKFITALSLQAVSGRAVRTDLWDSTAEAAMGHIELARWAAILTASSTSRRLVPRPYRRADRPLPHRAYWSNALRRPAQAALPALQRDRLMTF